MKRILTMSLFLLFLIALSACQNSETTPDDSLPNGLEPLFPTADCNVPTLEDGWVCVWADEFESEEIDETKWTFEIDGRGGGNNELQYYRRENAFIRDGNLVIEARQESFMNRLYTSARLNSKYKGDFLYGKIVVSAKMPAGRGTWPAIWMLPTMNAYGGWPNSGELDIMEFVGYDPTRVHSTIHTRKFNHNLGTQLGSPRVVPNLTTEFHTFETIWSPGNIQSFVNGSKYFEVGYNAQLNQEVPYHHAFPFDQLFHLILNVAVGGNWGGVQGVDPDAFPTAMEIEYVRVYQKDYATLDKAPPTAPSNVQLAQLSNTIWWRASTDDVGVAKYAVYVDGSFNRYANLNQVTFTGLTRGQSYQIQIQAVDFVGRVSELSDTFLLTYT